MMDRDATYRATFQDTIELDQHRRLLLRYARLASLPTLFFRIDKLPHTVVPRILRSPLVYVVVFAYIAAACSRGRHARIAAAAAACGRRPVVRPISTAAQAVHQRRV